MKQKITSPINHRETAEDLIDQNVDLFVEKDTDLGKTNKIKMSIDTGNHPPIIWRLCRTPFAKCPIVDKAVNDMSEDMQKMAFTCHRGLYEYNVMSFVWPMPLEYSKNSCQ